MQVAGLLLTGGSSRRMGTPKAGLRLDPRPGGLSLAERSARVLAGAASPAIEVGPGYTSLPAVADAVPGSGPLAAIASGLGALDGAGWSGPVLVLAADLPFVSVALLSFLADHGAPDSVIPLYGGWPQTLCARYSRRDLQTAAEIVKDGRRAMMDLVKLIDPVIVAVEEWEAVTADPDALLDVDTPADLERARKRLAAQAAPPGSDQA